MHNRWHPDLEPIAEVAPGEELRLEAADGLDGQLTRESSHSDAGTLDLGLGHWHLVGTAHGVTLLATRSTARAAMSPRTWRPSKAIRSTPAYARSRASERGSGMVTLRRG